MSYKILETKEQKTVITTVEFTLNDGSTKTIDVSHFMPKSEDDIIKGIENRLITENNRLDELANESKVE